MRENLAAALRLMLITDDVGLCGRDVIAVCEAAVRGGVTSVQLRLKRVSGAELVDIARRLVATLAVPVLVDDRLDVALAAGAAGVHLGIDDLAPSLARTVAPPGFLIGASVGSDLEAARATTADYWGIGPLRGSATKPDAGDALGFDGAAKLRSLAGGGPVVLIGGVTPVEARQARHFGFSGVAVSSAILRADDIEAAARGFR